MARSVWISLAFASTTAGIILVYSYYCKKKKNYCIPRNWKHVGYIEKIIMYPIKSGALWELNEAECTEVGLRETGVDTRFVFRDRCFLIYGEEDHKVLKLVKYRKIVLLSITSPDHDNLIFQVPDFEDLNIKLSHFTKTPRPVKLLMGGTEIDAVDCGDKAAKWISLYLMGDETGFRMGYFLENHTKRLNPVKVLKQGSQDYLKVYQDVRDIDGGLFADISSYMILSSASVYDVNDKLPLEDSFTYGNLRPNIVVGGCEKYAEDEWKWIKVGENVVMRNFKPCTRCFNITINPENSEKNKNGQPLKILKSYRTVKQLKGYDLEGNSPILGIYAGLYVPGKIKIGDPVYTNN